MCMHDGIDEECGPHCPCPCDNCVLGDDDDDDEATEPNSSLCTVSDLMVALSALDLRARGTAATLEAENARLRAGIEALADEWGKAGPGTEAERVFGRQKVSVEFAVKALRALLAEGGE